MVRVAAFGATEDLEAQGMEPFVEKRVARRQQHQVASLSGHRKVALNDPAEDCLCLNGIELRQHFYRLSKIVSGISEETGDLVKNPLDLSRLSGNRCGQPVVELNNTEGLDERSGAPSRNVEKEPVKLGTSRGSYGQAITVAPHRWRRIGHNLPVRPAETLELSQDIGACPRDLSP
jgi:hypothetical protein